MHEKERGMEGRREGVRELVKCSNSTFDFLTSGDVSLILDRTNKNKAKNSLVLMISPLLRIQMLPQQIFYSCITLMQ